MEQNGCTGWVSPPVPGELGGDDSLDVFEKDKGRLSCSDSVEDGGEEVPWVFVGSAFSGGGKGLAREAARDDVHEPVKLCEREGAQIRPDRCWVQESRFHFRDQIGAGEGFDLTKSNRAQTWDCSLESKVNAAVPGAE
jgi:hypothetical protein